MQNPSSRTPAPGYTLESDALIPNTFGVTARARRLVTLHDAGALPRVWEDPALPQSDRMLVLGAGSNILFTSDYPGAVLRLATRGIAVREDPGGIRARVAAGENWDAFVRWSLTQGLAGLENLVLIPGTVGAAPIQNIGAYGVEVSEFVEAVDVWDRSRARFETIDAAGCEFDYRNSVFKREPGRYIVTTVTMNLPRRRKLRLQYSGVREELAAMSVGLPAPAEVARAVERLRRRKLPDPAVLGNAGSFFKNPVIATARARALRERYPDLPLHPAPDPNLAKLSAGWLIEACGFRGYREGDAGVSERHALVLVNYGAATGADLWRLAQRVAAAVRDRFEVDLEPEPLIL